MRVWLIIAFALALVFLVGWRLVTRRSTPWISMGILVFALIPMVGFEIRWQIMEHAGTQIVKQVSGKPGGYLRCARFTEALLDISNRAGEVRYNKPNEAYVHYQACQDFMSLLNGDKTDPSLAQITALHVLTHESIHVSGDYDEADTECRAIAADPGVAESIGITPQVAQAMQQRYLRDVYPHLNSEYKKTC